MKGGEENMRKTMTLLMAIAIVFVLIGGVAYGWKGGGWVGSGPYYASVDPAKAQKFYNDTLPLRQKQLQIRSELMQLYGQPNPNWDAIAKKQQEMLQIRNEIQKRAYEYGLPYGRGMKRFGRGW